MTCRRSEEEQTGSQGRAPGMKPLKVWPGRLAASRLACVSRKELSDDQKGGRPVMSLDVLQEHHFSSSRKVAFHCVGKGQVSRRLSVDREWQVSGATHLGGERSVGRKSRSKPNQSKAPRTSRYTGERLQRFFCYKVSI